MRIIGGRHRGRKLSAPAGQDVRPTADRTREALFNILAHGRFATSGSPFAGRRVLDAFAGTGAFGLEALSRGAVHATFLELAPAALKALAANVAGLGEEARTTLLRADATTPPAAPAPCALVGLDPPYGSGLSSPCLAALAARGWLEPGALAVAEIAATEAFEPPPGFLVEDERRYAAARLVILRWAAPG
jgi:16S rRNA (guanine966-N2)-methyltransferase